MNLKIRTNECAWSNFDILVLGMALKGLRGFEFKKSHEQEHLYGTGDSPQDIQKGNKAYEGNIKLLGFDYDRMNQIAQAAGYDDITDVPHDHIVITGMFRKRKTDPITFVNAIGVSFGEWAQAMEQGAKYREVSLPFLAMNITSNTI